MKKMRKKKIIKQMKLIIIVTKMILKITSSIEVSTAFDVKDKTNIYIKLLQSKMIQ